MSEISSHNLKKYDWANDLHHYISCMTWGQEYGGEKYWKEEENWLIEHYSGKNIDTVLSVGCGLFRELNTLKLISSRKIIGIDAEKKFIDYLENKTSNSNDTHEIKLINKYIEQLEKNEIKCDLVTILFNTIGFFSDIDKSLEVIKNILNDKGEVIISVWNDNKKTTDFRKKIYTKTENKVVTVEYNKNLDLEEIIVRKKNNIVFRSSIIDIDWLNKHLKYVFLNYAFRVYKNELSTIIKISL